MPELRSALPYVSHLKVTKRPTNKWVPTGRRSAEGDEYVQDRDLPGIECEITPYVISVVGTEENPREVSVKGPATQFRFPSKAFLEAGLASLEALPVKTEQDTQAIAALTATIARTNVIWVEDVLAAVGLPGLDDLWATVYSDALDEFPTWRESENPVQGIPLVIKEMQWDARIPSESAKSIQLKIGVYPGKRVVVDGVETVVADESRTPELYTLNFEDAQTKQQRLNRDTQIQQRITALTAQIPTLEAGPEKAQAQAELDRFTQEQAQRATIEQGELLSLVSNPSVASSLPALIMGIVGALRSTHWPDLDMQAVQTRLADNLSAIQ